MNVPIGETNDFEFYFTPQEPGKYVVSGRVYYDGKKTFCRQFGTYPLIVGVKERLELKKFYNLKVTNHMLRSVVAEQS